MAAETWLTRAVDFVDEWAIWLATIVSLSTYLLIFLAESRRRCVSPGWTFALWLVYQTLDMAGSYALGNLSLNTTGQTEAADPEQVLIAFWAPLLLLHLGGPDNVSAYSLDDDKLYWRKFFGALWKTIGAAYIVYTKILIADKGFLSVASFIMISVAIFRYIELAVAFLLTLRSEAWGSSSKKKQQNGGQVKVAELPVDFSCRDNEDARRIAQGQWQHCGYRALFDSSVEMNSIDFETSKKIFNLGWKDMCEVAEIVASLMYDMLYTKASVVYSMPGYILRVISPFATFATAILFGLYPKDTVQLPDLLITWFVLGAALVADVVWLVTALASTWTYAFLCAMPGTWLHHKVLCSGWWCCIRRFTMCLHPWRLLGIDPSSYRMWSGIIGRFDLLHKCTRTPSRMGCLCGWLVTILGLEDVINQYHIWKCSSQLPQDVKELLFKRIKRRLSGEDDYSMKDIKALWGQEAVKKSVNKFDGLKLHCFGDEFQEDILLWHIGTTIYLWSNNQQQLVWDTSYAKAIEVISEYLMFLVVLRPHMLPEPALGRLYEVTCQALKEIWGDKGKENSLCCSSRKQKLAEILCEEEKYGNLDSNAKRHLISGAARLAITLQEVKPKHVPNLLELIFDVWVDKLLYAAIRCNRESHARQLGRGGELITIVWIMAEHAGLFRIGENNYIPPNGPGNGIVTEKTCCPKNPAEAVCSDFCCEQDYYYCQGVL